MAAAYNAEQPLFLYFFPCGIANLKIRGLQTRAASNREWLRMARVQVVSITKCKVSVLGVDSFFFIIKIKPRHKHAKWPPSDTTPQTLSLGLFMEFITGAHCTMIMI